MKSADMNYSAANRMISDLANLRILREVVGPGRTRFFVFDEYVKLFLTKPEYRENEEDSKNLKALKKTIEQ